MGFSVYSCHSHPTIESFQGTVQFERLQPYLTIEDDGEMTLEKYSTKKNYGGFSYSSIEKYLKWSNLSICSEIVDANLDGFVLSSQECFELIQEILEREDELINPILAHETGAALSVSPQSEEIKEQCMLSFVIGQLLIIFRITYQNNEILVFL